MDASSPVRRRLAWRSAAVASTIAETPSARTLTFDVEGWAGHVAGQHLDVRLTANDGYQATRSYSLSSGPDEGPQITVERVDDGEVSPFLVDVAAVGTTVELRGPIGGYFVLHSADEPVLLIGGGSGIAPLRSMWRAKAATTVTVAYSARTWDRVIFADELCSGEFDVEIFLTRERREGCRHGRIDTEQVERLVAARAPAASFVCGPTAFVETVAASLVDAGVAANSIRTERFG